MINLRIVKDAASMSRELKMLLDQMFYGLEARVCLHGQPWSPPMDIYETPEAFVVLAELPGLGPEEIEVIMDRTHLKVKGCRRQPAPPPLLRVHQMEISYGSFERTFHLPSPVSPEKASATSDHGLLKIVLPKEASR